MECITLDKFDKPHYPLDNVEKGDMMGNKTQDHHILYQQAQRQTLGCVWDNTTTQLPIPYHQGITNLQRNGVPAITTYAVIQSDKYTGRG